MSHARMTVTLPEMVWIGAVSQTYPDVTFEVLAALPADDRGVGLVELSGRDVLSAVAAMEDHEAVTSLSIVGTTPEEAVIQFETTEPLLLFSARESGLPLQPPITIRDGTATLELTTSRDRLAAMADQLDAMGLDYHVEWIKESVDPERVLTARQRELVLEAVEAGYYDSPRDCTLTELADDLGLAASTLSETLHRAEGKVVREFVADLSGATDDLRE
ncbi:helix-turn-helix domain-containing protein [Salinirubrum litoreum]|uniref:Helix-turn-helix domain-containing protein n=1 Tax=Salinirubrum litoreum TaxID=1126234 RepID=A0ABD5R812_9EURY|nr:helix-turn-helix domain-containing protein [Salinirubrum litoreum]